jgi:hypothetical protein
MAFVTRARGEMRRIGIVSITLGAAAIAVMLFAYQDNRKTMAGDIRDVTGLQRQLDSVRAQHRAATDSVTAKRLGEEVAMRESGLSRRAFHIPLRQESVRVWWTFSGAGVRWTALGALLIALGSIALRSGRREGSAATRTPRHGGS